MVLLVTQNVFAVDYGAEYENQPAKAYIQTFKDVKTSYWAFEYISEMAQRNVLNGYPNGYFYPENPVTRAEFAKIMASAASLSISKPQYKIFRDVDINEWYAPYVHTACNYLSGFNYSDGTYYLPETNALREDIAVALVKLKGYDTTGADISMLKAMFTDYSSISSSAQIYVATAIEKGLISGYSDNTFKGQNTITRAEAATLLWRAYHYCNENKNFDVEEKPISSTQKTLEEEPAKLPEVTADPVPEPTPEPIVTAEVDTVFCGDYRISDYCLESENSGYFMTIQNMDFETWIEGFYYFDETGCKKIADYNDLSRKEMESDDGNVPVICYPGNMPYEMYVSDAGKLIVIFKGEVYSEFDSSGTEEAYITATISSGGEFKITDIKKKDGSYKQKYTVGRIDGRMYNTIGNKTYSYNASANQIYTTDLLNGGENNTKVESGMPAVRTAGLWKSGFGVLADNTFYILSTDGNYEIFYQMGDGLKINDNKSMQDLQDFYIFKNSIYFISDGRTTLRRLKKISDDNK